MSYVHEDDDHIDKLCGILQAADIPYWRDRADLGPGDMWKSEIRSAITSGSLAFLACFSSRSIAKDKSYQNEELTLAADEFRQRPPGRTWLIPVRFDDCEIPEWDLGGGRTLRDINYIDLFGDNYTQNAVKLIEAIKKATGLGAVDPTTVRTAVEEAAAGDRPAHLRRLTKEMIREPSREIELDELISQEVARILAALRDEEKFPHNFPSGMQDELIGLLVNTADEYRRLVEPFCWSLQVAARWGAPESLNPWIKGLRALDAEAMKPTGGSTVLLELRHIPILLSTFVAAMASTGQARWDNFKALLTDNTVSIPNLQGKRVSIIESISPWEPFSNAVIVPNALARSAQTGDDFATAIAGFGKEYGQYHTPVAEWLFYSLRSIFDEQFHDDEAYEDAFDRAEIAIGVVHEDLGNTRDGENGRPFYFRNTWFGRSTWRYARRDSEPVQDLGEEQELQGSDWKPLRAGLFGGSADRALAAIKQYDETFRELASKRW